jgi:hypothetical protein
MYFCILNLIIINLNFITMRKIFILFLALTFIFGGLANAQQLKSIAKAKASVNAVANTNAEIGAFKMNGEKPAEKPATGKQVKLNSLLGSGAKATTVYSEDFTGGMGGWTVVGLGDGSWSVKDESNAGGTAPELMLEWVSGSDFDGQSYCMSPVINTTGYTTLALEFKQWFRNYQGSSVLGVYTTIDDGATWEEVWSETVSANFVEVKNLLITNAHVGNANFRIAFGFNGNTFDIWEWAIDDILLVEPDAHDLAIVAINLNTFVESGSTVTPQVTIRNMGISNEATWSLTLTDGDAYTSTKSDILINIGDNLVVDMDDWTPADGQYTLTATLTLTDDANTSNNTLTATVDVIEFSTAFAWNAYHEGGLNATGEGPVNIVLQTGIMTQIAEDDSDFIAAADYVGLEIYGIRYADGVPCPLVKIDPVTGVVTNIGGGAPDLTGFAYDVTSSTAYVIDFDGMLSTVDLETGVLTNIGGNYPSVIGLACSGEGNLFAISLQDHVASINKETGAYTMIGDLGVDINYAQDIAYDRDNDVLYGALYTSEGGIYQINLTTGAASLIADVGDELTGFAIPYTNVGAYITFNVSDESEPIQGALVEVDGKHKLTDDNGVAVIFVNEGDNIEYTVSKFGYISFTGEIDVVDTEDQEIDVTLESDESAEITFVVIDEGELALEDAVITVYLEGVVVAEGSSNDAGEYIVTLPLNTYTYNVSLLGFISVNDVVFNLTEDMIIEVELLEIVLEPYGLMYEFLNNETDVLFSWNNAMGFVESFEESFPPEGWTVTNTNTTQNWQQVGTLNFQSGSVVPVDGSFQAHIMWDYGHQDEWLKTEEFTVPVNGELVFWSYSGAKNSPNGDHYYVKISTDGGATWDILWDAVTHSYNATSTYEEHTVDLSAYSAQNAILAWQAIDGDGQGLWYAWMIDFIEVKQGGSKALESFNVYLDGELQNEEPVTDTEYTFLALEPGNYEAGVSAVYSYDNMSEIVTINFSIIPVGVEENVAKVLVYPNPASDYLIISTEGNYTVKMLNLSGQIVSEKQVAETVRIDVKDLPNGIYFIQIATEDGQVVTKFVKN